MKFKFKQLLSIVFIIGVVFVTMASSVLAATLQLSTVSGVSVGQTVNINTTDTTPTLAGVASPEATVDISLDDLTVAVLADVNGDWSYTPITALDDGTHDLSLASNLETLNYVLVVDTGTSESTTTTTTTTTITDFVGVGGATESSSTTTTLPVSGGLTNTFLMMVGGLFLIGLGLVTQQFSPAINELEDASFDQDITDQDQTG